MLSKTKRSNNLKVIKVCVMGLSLVGSIIFTSSCMPSSPNNPQGNNLNPPQDESNLNPPQDESNLNSLQDESNKSVAVADTKAKEKEYVPEKVAMFSWKQDNIKTKNSKEMLKVAKKLGVNTIYQYLGEREIYTKGLDKFISYMGKNGIDVYSLSGTTEMGYDGNARTMKKVLDSISEYNKDVSKKEQLKGVIFDVEPYTDNRWKTDELKYFARYDAAMSTAYDHAQSLNIYMITCIPYWLDSVDRSLLKSVIKHSDEIAVMNYHKGDESKNIKTEVEYAIEYEKPITSIFEFIKPNDKSVKDVSSYYYDGIPKAKKSFDTIYKTLKYDKLWYAYHHFGVLEELTNK